MNENKTENLDDMEKYFSGIDEIMQAARFLDRRGGSGGPLLGPVLCSSDFESLVAGEMGEPAGLAEILWPELTRKDKAMLAAAIIYRAEEDFNVLGEADAQVLENLLRDLMGKRGKCGTLRTLFRVIRPRG